MDLGGKVFEQPKRKFAKEFVEFSES
jgi:hypothetical protein